MCRSTYVIGRVLIACWQQAKKQATWRFEPSTFGGTVNRESEFFKNIQLLLVLFIIFLKNSFKSCIIIIIIAFFQSQ